MINQPGSDKLIRLHPYSEHHIIEAQMPGGGVMFNLTELQFSPKGEVTGMTPPIASGLSPLVIENYVDQLEAKVKDMRLALERSHYGFTAEGNIVRLSTKSEGQEVEEAITNHPQPECMVGKLDISGDEGEPDLNAITIDTAKRISRCIIKPLADWGEEHEIALVDAIRQRMVGEIDEKAARSVIDPSQIVRVTLFLDKGQMAKYSVMVDKMTVFLAHGVAKHLEKAAGIAFHHVVGATIGWKRAWYSCPACKGDGVHFWNNQEYEYCFCTKSHGRVHPDQCTFCGSIPNDHLIFKIEGNGATYLCPVGQAMHYADKEVTFAGKPYDEAVYAHLGTLKNIREIKPHLEGNFTVEGEVY